MRGLLLAALLPTMMAVGGAEHDNTYSGDYCPRGTFPEVVCEDDWPCSEVLARIETGECWVYVPRTDLSEGR